MILEKMNINRDIYILVVDDDPGLLKLIVKNLLKAGYYSEGISKGEDALEYIRKNPNAVLLLDHKLPDMTGSDIINILRDEGLHIPFIMMTGQGDERLAVEMMKLGAADYLVKDIDLIELLPGTIERLINTINIERKLKQAENEKKELQEKLNIAQKMELVGRLAGGVAHDFNNMLSVIISHADMGLLKLPKEDPLFSRLKEIKSAAIRSAELTRQLLYFSRKSESRAEIIDINLIIGEMLSMLKRLIGENIKLIFEPCKKIDMISIDTSQLDQIMGNLCVNARDAIKDTGEIIIKTDNTVLDEESCKKLLNCIPGEYVMISVQDDGCGIKEELLPKVFEPFYSTKDIGKGTGLGLSTVYGIVKQNKGYIDINSKVGRGTTIKVFFPRHSGNKPIKKEESEDEDIVRKYGTILLVEDEPMIMNITKSMLNEFGYEVLCASSPLKAIEIARKYTDNIHLLMTDIIMPGMNGRDLSNKIISLYPGIKVLFMSGYTADLLEKSNTAEKDHYFLQKPFSIMDLYRKLDEMG